MIHDGRTGTPMPPFAQAHGGALTDAQVKVLADGIKSHWKATQRRPPIRCPRTRSPKPKACSPRPAAASGARKFSRGPAPAATARTAAASRTTANVASAINDAGVSGADQRSGPPPHHHHRPARSRHAELTPRTTAARTISNRSPRPRSTTWSRLLADWRTTGSVNGKRLLNDNRESNTIERREHGQQLDLPAARAKPRPAAARSCDVLTGAVRHGRGRGAAACRWSATSSDSGSAACTGSTWARSPIFRSTKRGGSSSTIRLRQPWDGITALTGVYARYEGKNDKAEDQFLVLAVNCAHLGCPVTWFQQSGLFMCPCHGGVYYAERRARLRPAAARNVPLRVARRERQAADSGTALSDAARHAHRHRCEATRGDRRRCSAGSNSIGNWFDARLGWPRRAAADDAPSRAAGDRRADGLVVRLRQRVADVSS